MQTALTLSLLLNIFVLIPVCIGLITNADCAVSAYGDPSPARNILLSVYLSIALISVLLLMLRDPKMVMGLLLVQVTYKLTTPMTVGTLGHPVVVSNLLVAAAHSVTLAILWRSA